MNILAYSHAVPQPGMTKSYYKTDHQRFSAAWHAGHCTVEHCEWCDYLCDSGSIVSCDGCGHVHHTDWEGWVPQEVAGDGSVAVVCPECS